MQKLHIFLHWCKFLNMHTSSTCHHHRVGPWFLALASMSLHNSFSFVIFNNSAKFALWIQCVVSLSLIHLVHPATFPVHHPCCFNVFHFLSLLITIIGKQSCLSFSYFIDKRLFRNVFLQTFSFSRSSHYNHGEKKLLSHRQTNKFVCRFPILFIRYCFVKLPFRLSRMLFPLPMR